MLAIPSLIPSLGLLWGPWKRFSNKRVTYRKWAWEKCKWCVVSFLTSSPLITTWLHLKAHLRVSLFTLCSRPPKKRSARYQQFSYPFITSLSPTIFSFSRPNLHCQNLDCLHSTRAFSYFQESVTEFHSWFHRLVWDECMVAILCIPLSSCERQIFHLRGKGLKIM